MPTNEIQTYGEKLVGIRDNPDLSDAVDETKRVYSWMIDTLHNKYIVSKSEARKAALAEAIKIALQACNVTVEAVRMKDVPDANQ